MPTALAQRSGDAPAILMQGIAVPPSSVDPQAFARLTRRMVFPIANRSFQGLGNTDLVQILQSGIVAGLKVRFVGSVVVTLPTGTAATTARWPYDLIKNLRVSANGQSNLINVGGNALKLWDVLRSPDLCDRGVTNGVGGASPGTSRNQGTLALASESWGLGSNVSAIPAATYAVDLDWYVPVAFEETTLIGAIFAQTAATDLNLSIDWASQADLFTLTGTATATVTGTLQVETVSYSIPQGPNGDIIVPDLSVFHQLVGTRFSQVSNSLNEVKLAGQGIGRQLQRLFWRTFNGATPAPLVVNDTNYGNVGWRYGGNDTPEIEPASIRRQDLERHCGTDVGAIFGWVGFDWADHFAFRDAIDEGAATEIRFLSEIPNALSLTSPFIEYVQETLFAGSVGA